MWLFSPARHDAIAMGTSDCQAAESICCYTEIKQERPQGEVGVSPPKRGGHLTKELGAPPMGETPGTMPHWSAGQLCPCLGPDEPTCLPETCLPWSILCSPELTRMPQRGHPTCCQPHGRSFTCSPLQQAWGILETLMAGWHISHSTPNFEEDKIPPSADVGLVGHGHGQCQARAACHPATPPCSSLTVLLKRLKKKKSPTPSH